MQICIAVKNIKRILLIVSLLVSVLTAGAQSMSDLEVLEFVQKEQKAGTPQQQIFIKLMQRGVDAKQIQRLRKLYESSGGSGSSRSSLRLSSSSSSSSDANTRLRESNGSVRVDAEGNPLYSSMEGYNPLGSSEYEINDLDTRPNVYIKDSLNLLVNGKQVFGRDIFNKRTLSFEPNMNIPTPSSYVVGPGDQVVIDVYGATQKSQKLEVSPDGTVIVEGVGPIHLAGLSVEAANAKIKDQLGQRYSSSRIQMTVAQTRTITVNVMGEVSAPGTYTLSAFASVFHALYMAGGVNGVGTLRNIKVYRGGRQLTSVDVYDYILNGRLTGNVRLQDNDVIVVGPYDCLVDIVGNVKRPMAYEMKQSESVATLLKYAGGFSTKAYKAAVRLTRTAGNHYSAYSVSEFDMAGFHLMDGDSVIVDSILDRYENTITIRGAVFHPGRYDLDGTTTVRSLIERSGGLTEEAFSAHAMLYRMKSDRTRRVISIDVDALMAGTIADIALENEDDIYIPYRLETMSKRTLTIHGEVQFPGTYEYAEHQTIEDFIVQAGGLTDAASTVKIDVSRRILDPTALQSSKLLAKTYSFTLKNGLIIDRQANFFLEPYDEVYVRRSPGFETQRHVTIDGEAQFPGQYTMTTKAMKLSELVKAAGGVTKEAYVHGARIQRVMNEEEKMRERAVARVAENYLSRKDSIKASGMMTEDRYYVGIDLEKALQDSTCADNIILREGDRLFIPQYNPTVRVSGDVMYPNSVAYMPGKGMSYYIQQAGGYGSLAKAKKSFIVYQNGKIGERNDKIEPGCEIVVPSKPERQGWKFAQIFGISMSVVSLAAVIAALLK